MAQVLLTDVNKIYPTRDRAVHAVKDLNLTVEDGVRIFLTGGMSLPPKLQRRYDAGEMLPPGA